ncbi:3-dehydroquinate synthase [Salinicoccus jeotgali]|uniref:3-dehydroquinate synthase n=1 Tax=Salinicoccus jeotgali TaxID=381634 RepID=A0ABP7EWQ1_9STAP
MDIETTYNDNNYTIHIGWGILEEKLLKYTAHYGTIHTLVDQSVYTLYSSTIDALVYQPIILEGGEKSKNFQSYAHVMETLLSKGIHRNDLIIVIGGGASGDVGGFIASTVLRGVDYIQIPTTLLAHDSSIGGKTAINSAHGKNLIGTFYRPQAVIYDLSFLKTLPQEELRSGFGEVFKHALLDGEDTVHSLMSKTTENIQLESLEPYIISGIRTKMRHVTQDEKEAGIRRYLNLGHTFGHAIEYNDKLPHGVAVVLGLYIMMHVSNSNSNAQVFELSSYYRYFKRLGYPMDTLKHMDVEKLIALMSKDKKNQDDTSIGFILMTEIGVCHYQQIAKEHLIQLLEELKETL